MNRQSDQHHSRTKHRSPLRWIAMVVFYILFALVASAVVLADLSIVVEPVNKFMAIPSLIALAYEWLLVALVVLTLTALFTRHRHLVAVAAIVLLLSVAPVSHTVSLWRSKPKTQTSHKLTVLTYNTFMLACNNRTDTDKPLTTDMLDYIRRQDADVVFLQEVLVYAKGKGFTLEEIKQRLDYPYSYIDYKKYMGNRKYGTAIFSKYPLLDKKTIRYESKSNQSDMCLTIVENDTLILVNNHLESIKLTDDNFDFSERTSEQIKTKAHTIIGKMLHAYTFRSAQARKVREEIGHLPYKAVVCGDFNDTPVSYTYHTMSHNMRDAWLSARPFSFGHSFYHGLLGIRIDYILCSPSLYPVSATLDKVNYSDHYPLKATIEW